MALAEYNTNPYNLTNYTFEDSWKKWSPKHFEKNPSSANGLKSAYKRCASLHRMKLQDIRTSHLQAIIDDMRDMSMQSQTKVKTVFKNTFKWALENDVIQKDYSQFVTLDYKTKEPTTNYFNRDEVNLILKNLDWSEFTYTIVFMLYTGVRVSEMLGIQCEDINLEGRIIRVRGTKTENADRIVPIHKNLIPVLEPRMGQTFLVEHKNKKMTYSRYKIYVFDEFMKHLGLSQTPHAMRHTFISLMDRSGVSATDVALKRIVGHSNDSITEHYVHKDYSDLIECIDRLKL